MIAWVGPKESDMKKPAVRRFWKTMAEGVPLLSRASLGVIGGPFRVWVLRSPAKAGAQVMDRETQHPL